MDEKGVYVFFPDYGLLAYDFDGKERWQHPLEPFENVYGMGASPVVAGDKVILVCDQNLHSFIVALNRDTGEVAWRADRPEATSGHSTPVLNRDSSGELEVIVPGSFQLTSYSAATGRKLWWVTGLSFEMKSTPVLADGIVYINGYGAPENQPGTNVQAPSWTEALAAQDKNQDHLLSGEELQGHARSWFGFTDLNADGHLDEPEWKYYEAALASRNGILAIRVGGEGDMTEKNVAWAYHKRVPQLPSPLLYQGVLYMVNDGGVVTSLDPASGEVRSQGRLKGAVDNYYASPVAADGKIFMASELGKVAVVKPGGRPRDPRGERSRRPHLRDSGDRQRTALRANPRRALLLRRIMILAALLISLLALDAGEDLREAVRRGDIEKVRALLDSGVPVDAKNRYGATALFFAADKGHLAIVELLVARGADIDVEDTFYRMTPVARAFDRKHEDVALFLLNRALAAKPLDRKSYDEIFAGGEVSRLREGHCPSRVDAAS